MKNGQAISEYAIILGLVAIVVVLILATSGVSLKSAFCSVVRGLGGSGAGCETAFCSDSFSSLSNWSDKSNYEIRNGMLCNKVANGLANLNTCSQNTSLPSDYSITLDIATLLSGNGYGIFFRTQSTNPVNGYIFQYDPGLKGFVFRKWVNGAELGPFASYYPPSGYNWNTPHKVQVTAKGNTFKAYIDDQLVLTATDSTYTRGGSGFRTWDSTRACFDNFAIQTLP